MEKKKKKKERRLHRRKTSRIKKMKNKGECRFLRMLINRRNALGDDGGDSWFIRTWRGYQGKGP